MDGKEKILVVDDSPETLFATSRVVRQAGYDVIEARTGEECLSQIRHHAPDMVLLDVVLPDADGMELAAKIKTDPETRYTFVILLSSKKTSPQDRTLGLNIGADGYILRPISNKELEAHVHAFCRIKNMEKAIRSGREKLRITLESIADAVITTDHAGNIDALNPAAERLSGWSRHEAHGQPFDAVFKLVAPASRRQRENMAQKVLREGTIIELAKPTLLISRTGEEVFIADSGAPIPNDSGEITGAVLVLQDVSRDREKEIALEKSREEWEQIFQAIGHPAWILAPDHTILRINQAAANLVEKAADDLTGRKCYEVFHHGQSPADGCPLQALLRSGHMERVDMEMEALGLTFLVSCTPVCSHTNKLEKIIHIATDITERKRTEEALRESELKHRRLYESMMDAFVAVDMSGRIQEFNPSYQAMLGYSAEELQRLTYEDLTPAKWRAFEADVVATQILVRGYSDVYEKEYRRRDGSLFPVELRTFLIRDDAGQPTGMWAIVRDITERKRAEEEKEKLKAQLFQAQKMESVGRLAGGVAHDFNNMLGVILGFSELAMKQLNEADPLFRKLEEIHKAAQRSANLTRQLLAFARKQTISPQVLDLNETIEGMLKMLRRLIGEDIHVAWLPGKSLWKVNVDPSQIDQVLANLCVNARDAIAGVGTITIETRNVVVDESSCLDHAGVAPGEYLLLTLSDTGCGMDQLTLGRLFEPFFTTKEAGKGTGLGLATVYGIVKQNNGFINVESELQQGTTFSIYLPRYTPKSEQLLKEAAMTDVQRGLETILLVEDEAPMLQIAQIMLQSLGYRVLAAATPGEAMAMAREYPGEIHLLMTDVIMPEMNGRELAKRLLSLYPALKTVFMSGYTADVIIHHGVLDEGMHFLQKPFTAHEMALKVAAALGRAERQPPAAEDPAVLDVQH